MDEYVYEVVDTTDDEAYYPLGIYSSLKQAKDAIHYADSHSSTSAITSQGMECGEYEQLKIRKRQLNNWKEYDCGDDVYLVDRAPRYCELEDKYFWEIVEKKENF